MVHVNLSFAVVVVVQSSCCVQLFATPWTAARQASMSLTISQSLPKFMFIVSMMSSSHLILWCPLLLLPSIFPSIRVFSNESVLRISQPKCWSISFSIISSKEIPGLISFRMEERGTTEDEMAGWHHWLDGCESEWTLGVGDGQGGLACCNSWGHKESDMTEWLYWTELN